MAMFESLSERFSHVLRNLRGLSKISDENIQATLNEVNVALLDADVAKQVVDTLVDQIRTQALGQAIPEKVTPDQFFVKIVNDTLIKFMGEFNDALNLKSQPPAVVLMAGLQGSGKTTTTIKLARWLKANEKKSVMVASADIYRPAAIDQLETLALAHSVEFFPSHAGENPITIAKNALQAAKNKMIDVLIIDTAGRLHIDNDMMQEIQQIHHALNPIETLFVVDSMTGQDAVNTAKSFNEALALTGIILTKADGDARGGAALTMRHVTGKPIKFIGVGEKVEALEPFYPDRIASRILGMGDVVTLVEDIQRKVDAKKAEKMAQKIQKGHAFNFQDFYDQIQEMKKIGMGNILDKLPGMSSIPDAIKNKFNEDMFKDFEAMICSMTPQERQMPVLLNKASRQQRIVKGSGKTIKDLKKMLKQFEDMKNMLKKFSGPGLAKMMGKLQKLKGIMPF